MPLTIAACYLFAAGVTRIAGIFRARIARVTRICRTWVARIAGIRRARITRIARVTWIRRARVTGVARIFRRHLGGCAKKIDADFDVVVQLEKD